MKINETLIEENAIIESTSISCGDRDILEVWLHLKYDGAGQGFGGYVLYLPKSFAHHKKEGMAGHFIYRCMEIAGVTDWNKMIGKTIRVRRTHANVYAIGHIIENKWFIPEEELKSDE